MEMFIWGQKRGEMSMLLSESRLKDKFWQDKHCFSSTIITACSCNPTHRICNAAGDCLKVMTLFTGAISEKKKKKTASKLTVRCIWGGCDPSDPISWEQIQNVATVKVACPQTLVFCHICLKTTETCNPRVVTLRLHNGEGAQAASSEHAMVTTENTKSCTSPIVKWLILNIFAYWTEEVVLNILTLHQVSLHPYSKYCFIEPEPKT